MQKGDQDHGAGGTQHWVLLPDAPGRRWLTEGALPLALRASPGEETESQGDPQASPHRWACPEKEKHFLSSSGTASVLSRHLLVQYNPLSYKYVGLGPVATLLGYYGGPPCTKSSLKGEKVSQRQGRGPRTPELSSLARCYRQHAMEMRLAGSQTRLQETVRGKV